MLQAAGRQLWGPPFPERRHQAEGMWTWGRLEATSWTLVAKGAKLPRAPSSAPSRTLHRNHRWFRTPAGDPPFKGGQLPVPVSSVHPEAPDNLLEVLRGASIDEEHRTIMSAVVEKVQSAKNGLTKACASLLTGFEVSNQNIRKYYRIDSSP